MVAAVDHPAARRPASDPDHQRPRQWQCDRSGQPQPGCVVHTVTLCHGPTPALHQLAQADGKVAERVVPVDHRLGKCSPDHGHGHLQFARCAEGSLGNRCGPLRRKRIAMCNRILATLDAALYDSYNCSDLERVAISMSARHSLSHRLRRAPVTTNCL